jgi:hypothetical protein
MAPTGPQAVRLDRLDELGEPCRTIAFLSAELYNQ